VIEIDPMQEMKDENALLKKKVAEMENNLQALKSAIDTHVEVIETYLDKVQTLFFFLTLFRN